MTSIRLLLLVSVVLVLFSLVAFLLGPEKIRDGRTPLVWVTDNNPARAAQIEAFNGENKDLHLSLDYSNQGIQKIILQCSSGVGPDIFDTYNAGELQTYVDAGIAWDITEGARRGGFDAFGPRLWPGLREEVRYLNRQYSYPCNSGVNLLIYNKNIFDYLGLPYPEGILTWEDFAGLCIKIKKQMGTGGQQFAVAGLDWSVFFDGQRGEYFTEKGELRLTGSPELTQAFEPFYGKDARTTIVYLRVRL